MGFEGDFRREKEMPLSLQEITGTKPRDAEGKVEPSEVSGTDLNKL